jgi:hypothetical protein
MNNDGWSLELRDQTRSLLSQDGSYPKPYYMKNSRDFWGRIVPRPENFYGFCVIGVKEQGQVVYHEYATVDEVIDDGWAVD